MTDQEKLLKTQEVADMFGVKARTVQRWVRDGMPSRKVGKSYYFYWSEISKWVEEQAHEGDNADSG